MIYRPSVKKLIKQDLTNFTFKRWLRLPNQVFLNWIKTPVDIREPTPLPMGLRDELKAGYYWPELVH
jgi:hypothetical protein